MTGTGRVRRAGSGPVDPPPRINGRFPTVGDGSGRQAENGPPGLFSR